MYRIVIVDDHEIFRQGVKAMLDEKMFKIVGEAGDVQSARSVIVKQLPDVVLLDVHLGKEMGADVINAVRNLAETNFLALSVSDQPEDVANTIRAGALGYVTKTIDAKQLNTAVEQVANGYTVLSPKLAGFLLETFSSPDGSSSSKSDESQAYEQDDDYNSLSPKERQVLQFIARGYSYKRISEIMQVTTKTIESHMKNVLRKLQLTNRHEVTYWAMQRKII
jgi:DNA-binding NarL/FixJ family response regulator